MPTPGVRQITRTGREWVQWAHRTAPRPRGAHARGQAVRSVRAPRMWCAHPGPPVRAPPPPCAHRWCGGRGRRRTTMRTGAAAGSARHRRCAHGARDAVHRRHRVRASDAGWSHSPIGQCPRSGLHSHPVDIAVGSTLHSMRAAVESTPTGWRTTMGSTLRAVHRRTVQTRAPHGRLVRGAPGCGGGQFSSMAWRSPRLSSFVPRSAAVLCVQATIAGWASSYRVPAGVVPPSLRASWVR